MNFLKAIWLGIFLSSVVLHAETTETKPLVVKLGVYILSLSDFNYRENNFHTAFRLWAWIPNGQGKWMKSLDFPESLSVKHEHLNTMKWDDGNWSSEEINAVFRKEWDRANYPFDKHKVYINLEESHKEASEIQFSADTSGSCASQATLPSDWKITKMEMQPYIKKYDTSFGDPRASMNGTGSEHAGMKIIIFLERISTAIFWKFTTVPYVASILCLISFLIPDNVVIMAKFSLLVGTLMAVILCMASSSAAIGAENVLTLVDKIHIISVLYILLGVLFAVFARWLVEIKIENRKIIRWNLIVGVSGFIVLIILNLRLVYTAMHA